MIHRILVRSNQMMSQENIKKWWFCLLGIAFGLSGLATAIAGFSDLFIRLVGILLMLGGAYLIRMYRMSRMVRLGDSIVSSSYPEGANHIRLRLVWILGAISLIASVISFSFMYVDATGGYHSDNVWPLYTFALSMMIFALTSSYIVGIFVRGILSGLRRRR